MDFSNSDSGQSLTELFVDRYGQKAYKALRGKILTGKSTDSEEASRDSEKLAKLLFPELVKREPVEPILVKQLADTRSQTIARQMTGPHEILVRTDHYPAVREYRF